MPVETRYVCSIKSSDYITVSGGSEVAIISTDNDHLTLIHLDTKTARELANKILEIADEIDRSIEEPDADDLTKEK